MYQILLVWLLGKSIFQVEVVAKELRALYLEALSNLTKNVCPGRFVIRWYEYQGFQFETTKKQGTI